MVAVWRVNCCLFSDLFAATVCVMLCRIMWLGTGGQGGAWSLLLLQQRPLQQQHVRQEFLDTRECELR